MQISKRTKNLGTENAFVVLAEVNKLISRGKDIVSFCIGQPDFDTPANIKRAAVRALKEGKTGYTPSAGIPELRKAAAKYLSRTRKIKIKPEEVVIANGAKPFISFVIASVTDPGKEEEVLFPNPGFPIYEAQIRAQGAVPVPLYLREKKGFNFDIEELAKKLNPRTRLLILNSPQNPTGGVLSKEELKEIAKLVKKYPRLWVFSDEVYSRMAYDNEFQSIASIPGMQRRTIVVDGVSKTYAMTGWRIGFGANKILAPHFTRWMTNTTSCANHPAQYAALEALTGPQKQAQRMAETFKKRRGLIVNGLNEIRGIRCLKPGGAFYVWPNVTEACKIVGARDSEDFRKRLLYKAGVAVLADIHFGPRVRGEGQHIRLSYATSTKGIREGVRRIGEYIESF